MVVFLEGASASALGVATFQKQRVPPCSLSGLLCDRFGVGVEEKNILRHGVRRLNSPLSPPFLSCRLLVALNLVYPALYHSFLAGLLAVGSLREMRKSPGNGLHAGVHYMELHRRHFCVTGRGAGGLCGLTVITIQLPDYMVDVSPVVRWVCCPSG